MMADKNRRYTPEQIIEWWKCCSKQSPEHHCMKCQVQEDCIDVTQEPEDFYKHIALRTAELLHDALEREKQQWISVKERMPDNYSFVLAFIHGSPHDKDYTRVQVLGYDANEYQPEWDYVTHWMPKPEYPAPAIRAADPLSASFADGGGLAPAT